MPVNLLKAHNHLFWPIFLSTTFYDLKVTFGYIGESPENFMYTGSMSILRINIVFFGPNMAASQLPWIF